MSEACYLLQFEDLLFLCVHYFKVTVNDEFLQSKWAILLSPKVVVFFFQKTFHDTFQRRIQNPVKYVRWSVLRK